MGSQPGVFCAPVWLLWAAPTQLTDSIHQAAFSRMYNETWVWESSSGLPGALGTAWHDQPRPSSSQTADLALALCDGTRSHREALTVSSPKLVTLLSL